MDNRDRRSPVALAADTPVADPEVRLWLSEAAYLQIIYDFFTGIGTRHTIVLARIHHDAFIMTAFVVGCIVSHYANNWQVEFLGEFVVSFVVGGNSHNRTGAVASQDIIRYPNGDFRARKGVERIRPRENTRFFFVFLAFHLGFFTRLCYIRLDFTSLVWGSQGFHQLMFWGEHHESSTVQGVRPGREDGDDIGKLLECIDSEFRIQRHLLAIITFIVK